jgi:hypothetical protein
MSTPLVINDRVRADIHRVRDYALKYPLATADVESAVAMQKSQLYDRPDHWCVVPLGFRCAFTIEPAISKTSMGPLGYIRHLSVSMIKRGRVPSPPAMDMLMEEFGFTCNVNACAEAGLMWMEDEYAVNVCQFLEAEPGHAIPDYLPQQVTRQKP